MYTKDGFSYCVYCYESFAIGHHASYHLSLCRDKERIYVPMKKDKKILIVNAVESAMRDCVPGALIGYGEAEGY